MTIFLDRLVRQIEPELDNQTKATQPFSTFLNQKSIVLLGDPGSGKTTLLKREAQKDGMFITVRSLARKSISSIPTDKRLFIDGLDEYRSEGDKNDKIDGLISKLNDLENPRFCLSCRSEDWLGDLDLAAIKDATDNNEIIVLELLPLQEDEALQIIGYEFPKRNAKEFYETAKEKQLDSFLENPQTLILLLQVTTSGWPVNRFALYEEATKILAAEENKTHEDKTPSGVTEEKLIEAAGAICATLLISNKRGVSSSRSASDEDFVFIEDIAVDQESAREIIKRRLFSAEGTNQFIPQHRTTSEFLAARFLAQKINKGLPLERILSVITGEDKGTISELRGLFAWLSCHLEEYSHILLPLDAYGVLRYGDVSHLSVKSRKILLKELGDYNDPWFLNRDDSSSFLGELVSRELVDEFIQILEDENAKPHIQSLICEAVSQSAPIPEMSSCLEDVILDPSKAYFIRTPAAKTWEAIHHDSVETVANVFYQLEEELSSAALHIRIKFMQKQVSLSSKLESYLSVLKQYVAWIEKTGGHTVGITWHLREVIPNDLKEKLLRRISDYLELEYDTLKYGELNRFFLSLFQYVLETKTAIEPSFLWEVLSRLKGTLDSGKLEKIIQSYLLKNPEMYFKIVDASLKNITPDWKIYSHLAMDFVNLIGNSVTEVTLEEYIYTLAKKEPCRPKAQEYFKFSLRECWAGNKVNLVLFEKLHELSVNDDRFTELFEPWTVLDIEDWRIKNTKREQERQKRKEESRQDDIQFFQENLVSVQKGEHLGALDYLARIFFCNNFSNECKGISQINIEKDLNAAIAKAAIEGFKVFSVRTDFPTPKQIGISTANNKYYYHSYPAIAGIFLQNKLTIPEKNIPSIFCFTLAQTIYQDEGQQQIDRWRKYIIQSHPEEIISALYDFFIPQIESKKEECFWFLTNKDHFEVIAGRLSLQLLQADPDCHETSLKALLLAALLYADQKELLALCESILSDSKVSWQSHVYWHTAKWLIKPKHDENFFVYLQKNKLDFWDSGDLKTFFTFFEQGKSYFWDIRDLIKDYSRKKELSIPHLVQFIQNSTPHWKCVPYPLGDSTGDTTAYDATKCIQDMIVKLATKPSTEAKDAFTNLLNGEVPSWQDYLKHEQAQQLRLWRENQYSYPDITQTKALLENKKPVNMADLHCFIYEHLLTLQKTLQSTETNQYLHFWNTDSFNKAETPKVENRCRDIVIDLLKLKLSSFEITPEPEGSEPHNTRADIKVISGDNHLPIEAKRACHIDLWIALYDQLDAQYSSSMQAEGYGIYLVFWFDHEDCKVKNAPKGSEIITPKTADKLEIALNSLIEEKDNHRLKAVVLDLSSPT